MKLKIEKELFQWEKNRFVIIEKKENEPNVSCVQFYNKKSKIGPEIPIVNNKAQIPNILLKESFPIVALACTEDTDGTQVISRNVFKVLPRVRPEYYIDEEQDGPNVPGVGVDIIYDGGVEV